ncbi:hypothetical protein GCWU000342_00582 [Shuttleworthella satelles DSM 14600]|uniref:Uncharacterized protein n=1 Tax=Shuttleworthella satelles DSM 14600 TaxID=626523 RepID=C4G9D0_9FIRM|nr:hypothetical protein GCWU000342_00582 [Shuttleworthia satelles DSM 14600]
MAGFCSFLSISHTSKHFLEFSQPLHINFCSILQITRPTQEYQSTYAKKQTLIVYFSSLSPVPSLHCQPARYPNQNP